MPPPRTFVVEDEHLLGAVALPNQGILRGPGPTHESALAAQEALQLNHVKFDWQFTTGGLHNHLSHAILASYSLGASPDLLQDLYELHSKAQRPMCPLQKRISYQNWARYLGRDDFYSSYLVFFNEEIQKYGAAATLERYLFTVKEGQLLIRAVSGAIHPLIQFGHGVEFGLDALVAEGLAQACVHSPQVEGLFPPNWPLTSSSTTPSAGNSAFANAFSHFKALKTPSTVFSFSSKDSFAATISSLDPARPRHPRLGLSGFTILGHMLKDPRLAAGQANGKDENPRLGAAIRNRGDLIRAWCEEWVVDPAGGWREICEKLEEIFWIATVLVGASTRPGYTPRLDFFLMHTLTSAIFLPRILEILNPTNRIALLHSHFRVMVAYWVSRGRPSLYIKEMLMRATAYPAPPTAIPVEQGAIQRGIEKGGTEEVKLREEAERGAREDEGRASASGSSSPPPNPDQAEGGVKDSTTASSAPETTPNEKHESTMRKRSDSTVEVSLDSPTQEKAEPAFESIPEEGDQNESSDLKVDTNGDAAEAEDDALKTPTKASPRLNGAAQGSNGEAPQPTQKSRTRKSQSSAASWAGIIASAVDHTDEHTTKIVRSLAFAAQSFGMAPRGVYTSALPGSDLLDGSVFIRLAGMCMETMGWEHEGQAAGSWDRSVLGFDEAWADEESSLPSPASSAEDSSQHSQSTRASQSTFPKANPIESGSLFERRTDYPKKLDKGKGKAANQDEVA